MGGLPIAEPIAWGWVVAGVVFVAVSLGPVNSYMVATGASVRFGEFHDTIGLVGRLVVMVPLAAVLVGAIRVSGVPGSWVFNFNRGGMLAVAGVVAIESTQHREIASRPSQPSGDPWTE